MVILCQIESTGDWITQSRIQARFRSRFGRLNMRVGCQNDDQNEAPKILRDLAEKPEDLFKTHSRRV